MSRGEGWEGEAEWGEAPKMWIHIGNKKGKNKGKHCIDVWHMWRLAFPPPLPVPIPPPPPATSPAPSVCHQKSVARFSFCIFLLAARFHPLIRSFNRPFMHSVSASFIHSLTHSSHSFSLGLCLQFRFGFGFSFWPFPRSIFISFSFPFPFR